MFCLDPCKFCTRMFIQYSSQYIHNKYTGTSIQDLKDVHVHICSYLSNCWLWLIETTNFIWFIINFVISHTVKVRLHTAINRADFVSSCMLYTYDGNKMYSWENDAVLSWVNRKITFTRIWNWPDKLQCVNVA